MFNLYSRFYPYLSVSNVFATSSFHVFAGPKTIAKKQGKNTKANNSSWSFVFDRGLSHEVLVITQLLSSKIIILHTIKQRQKHMQLFTLISQPSPVTTISQQSHQILTHFSIVSPTSHERHSSTSRANQAQIYCNIHAIEGAFILSHRFSEV